MHNNKNIILTEVEKEKYEIIKSCIECGLTNQEAANRLGLKTRRIQYLKRKVQELGAKKHCSQTATNHPWRR